MVFGISLFIFFLIMLVILMKRDDNAAETDQKSQKNSSKRQDVGEWQMGTDDHRRDVVVCDNGDYGNFAWDAGYKQPPVAPEFGIDDREAMLEQIGSDAMQSMAAQTIPQLPSSQTAEGQHCACPMKTDWQGAFKGLPTTFITPPPAAAGGSCDVSPGKRDPRPWFTSLQDQYYARSRVNGEAWDPYKHYNARQMYAQFLASGMTNRKAFYERPIEQLEEATCFQNMVRGAK